MEFVVKRDILLKSLNFVQGVVEKKKYPSYSVECIITTER